MHLEIGISKNDCLSKVASDLFSFSIKDNNNTKKNPQTNGKAKIFPKFESF